MDVEHRVGALPQLRGWKRRDGSCLTAGLPGWDCRREHYLEVPGLESEQSFVQDGFAALGLEVCVGVHHTDKQVLYEAKGTTISRFGGFGSQRHPDLYAGVDHTVGTCGGPSSEVGP